MMADGLTLILFDFAKAFQKKLADACSTLENTSTVAKPPSIPKKPSSAIDNCRECREGACRLFFSVIESRRFARSTMACSAGSCCSCRSISLLPVRMTPVSSSKRRYSHWIKRINCLFILTGFSDRLFSLLSWCLENSSSSGKKGYHLISA